MKNQENCIIGNKIKIKSNSGDKWEFSYNESLPHWKQKFPIRPRGYVTSKDVLLLRNFLNQDLKRLKPKKILILERELDLTAKLSLKSSWNVVITRRF